ncbi:MAG: molybdopterin-guanine dinucleotide biosynthesis protein B [Thermoleophilia bacterium]
MPRDSAMEGFSIAILAGGESTRMGADKALQDLGGKPVIAHVIDSLAPLATDIYLVARDVGAYERFQMPICADQYSVRSSMVGIYSALAASRNQYCFTVACDMPFTEPGLVRYLASLAGGHDAAVPVSPRGREPLHAIYSRRCLEPMRRQIEAGDFSISNLLDTLDVRYVDSAEMTPFCDLGMVFLNVNTVVDLEEAAQLAPRINRWREQAMLSETGPGLPPLVCFVGNKNSGKTTFLEKLVPVLVSRGVVVAFLKHDVHGFEIDREGTDTWRLARAGAVQTVISSPGCVASVQSVRGEKELNELRHGLGDSIDLVIAEGFKQSAADRIEISRSDCSRQLVCAEDDLIAVVSDRPDAARTVPVFGLDDFEAVANLLTIRYGLGAGRTDGTIADGGLAEVPGP